MSMPPRSGSRLGHMLRRGIVGEETGTEEVSQNERMVASIFEKAQPADAEKAADVPAVKDQDVVPAWPRRQIWNDEPEVPTRRLDSVMVLGSYLRYAAEWLVRRDLRHRNRAARDELCVLGLRFTEDRGSPGERFDTLRRELGDAFLAIEIDSSPDNPYGISRGAHAVLTRDLVDEPGHPTRVALDQVLAFYRERLAVPAQ